MSDSSSKREDQPKTPGDQPADSHAVDAEEPAAVDYEGLLLRAGYNYHVFLAAMFGFVRSRGGTVGDFVEWTAQHVGGSWAALREHGADAVLRVILENLASTGYPVEQVEFGATHSIAQVGAVPLGLDASEWRDLLLPFGVEPNDMLQLFDVFTPLARTAGADLEIEEHEGTVRLTARKDPPRPGHQPIRFFDSP